MEKLNLVLKIILAVLIYGVLISLYLWIGSLIMSVIFSTDSNLLRFVMVLVLFAIISGATRVSKSVIKNESYKGGH